MNRKGVFLKFCCPYPSLIGVLIFLLAACSVPKEKIGVSKPALHLKYAKRFSISATTNYTLVSLFGKRASFDTTMTFVLSADTSYRHRLRERQVFVAFPCRKIAALSSIYSAMFAELGALDQLAAIDNSEYSNNKTILQKVKQGSLLELSKGPEPDLEQTLKLKPDLLFMFGMGESESAFPQRLREAGIPVAIVLDHLEDHPLGRAEWIRFFGAFSGQSRQADSLFTEVEKNYLNLKEKAAVYSTQPSVFSEIKYGDVWYMPAGKSFMALLIADAGGKYLWADVPQTGSLPLSLEQVLVRAAHADIWLNQPLVFSRKQLLAADSRYAAFSAFQTGKMYNNTKNRNASGYSDYWESGMIHPDRILGDLIQIFHGDSLAKSSLYYYEQLH